MVLNKIFIIFVKTDITMPYGTTSRKPTGSSTTKPLSQMTKAEKETRAREMNAEYAKTATTNVSKGKKVQGGIKPSFGQKLFGGRSRSTASTPKAKKSWSSNPARAARQKARAKGNETVCGPSGCMKRKKIERLRDR